MYNRLELKVAKLLLEMDLKYDYGKIVKADNFNGFLSIDFVLDNPPLVIEVTYWDKIEQKCTRPKRKFTYLKNIFGHCTFIVITKTCMRDRYKSLLQDNTTVLAPSELEQFIHGIWDKSPSKAG